MNSEEEVAVMKVRGEAARPAGTGELGGRGLSPATLVSLPAVEYRNRLAVSLEKHNPSKIVGSYVYVTAKQMQRMVRLGCHHLGARPFRGVGLEPGAGCGLLSAVVAKQRGVEKIFAVEICEELCKRIIPKVSDWILGPDAQKVIPVWGSFDGFELPDSSIDFIVEIDSLHHSDDLTQTLRECARVLKPGGQMLCFDRCHPDTVTDEEIEEMLSLVYSERFLEANCYPPGIRLTRRENGEHEFRLREWKEVFRASDFRLAGIRRFVAEIRFEVALKGVLGFLPRAVRRRLYHDDNGQFALTMQYVSSLLQPLPMTDLGKPILAPRSSTVFLLEKA